MKKIFLDCGAHDGCSIQAFVSLYSDYNEYEIYSFECDQKRFDKLSNKGSELGLLKFTPINKAVWINNGRKIFDGWQLKNTSNLDDNIGVETIDFSQFIINNFSKDDFIVLKLDIEGAEYKVIDKMFKDDSLSYISKIYGELHGPKKGFTIEDNNEIFKKLRKHNLKLYNWDSLEGDPSLFSILELVPYNESGSFNDVSSPRVGVSYKKII